MSKKSLEVYDNWNKMMESCITGKLVEDDASNAKMVALAKEIGDLKKKKDQEMVNLGKGGMNPQNSKAFQQRVDNLNKQIEKKEADLSAFLKLSEGEFK
jgi:hypothetical protein